MKFHIVFRFSVWDISLLNPFLASWLPLREPQLSPLLVYPIVNDKPSTFPSFGLLSTTFGEGFFDSK